MVREIVAVMYFNIDEKNCLEIIPKEVVSEKVERDLKELYCDDEGFDFITVDCVDMEGYR